MNLSNFPFPPQIFPLLALGYVVLVFVLAWAVKSDADRRLDKKLGVFLVGPWTWYFVILFSGGFAGTLAFWLIHYSALRHIGDDQEKT